MAYIEEYWQNKNQRANKAREHTKKMQIYYEKPIRDSVSGTKIYDDNSFASDCENNVPDTEPKIIVEPIDSVAAVMKYGNPGAAVLNFSSYKNPGGMFINGSRAQEECLCHESFLYNVLREFQTEFYTWNCMHKNKALYLNRGLFSPCIRFVRGNDLVECGVITCAAPNKSVAQRYQNVSDAENTKALRSRIKFVLDIAKDNNIHTLILGAYGCGVFGQDAAEVAGIFKEYLTTTHKCFPVVVFAVPEDKNGNYKEFAKTFSD